MMKELISYYVDKREDWAELIRSLGVDGMESLIYGKEEDPEGREVTVGCHLKYWPSWVDFYMGNEVWVQKDFPTEESRIRAFGGTTPYEWMESIKGNIRSALSKCPEYLVWHVADCSRQEVFSRDFHHTNLEVLSLTAEIFEEIKPMIPSGVKVLFENLFWPGLTLLEPKEVEDFFQKVGTEKAGIILDTGHLMNTNTHLTEEEDGISYVLDVVRNLGSLRDLIEGMHLSLSLSGAYQQSTWGKVPDVMDDRAVWRHVSQIDQHRPFTSPYVREIIDLARPKVLVHELFGNSGLPYEEIKTQRRAARLDTHPCEW